MEDERHSTGDCTPADGLGGAAGGDGGRDLSAAEFRLIADSSYDWAYWQQANGTFAYLSPSCQRITGYSPEEFMADPELYVRIVHPSDREGVREHFRSHEDCVKQAPLEYRILRRDGEERWIGHACQEIHDAQGRLLGRRGANRDITAAKHMEAELRETQFRFDLALANAPVVLMEQDRDLRCLWMHHSQLGMQEEEVVGRTEEDLFGRDAAADVIRLKRRAIEEGGPARGEVRLQYRGEESWWNLHAEPRRDAQGRVVGVVSTAINVTEAHRAAEAVRASEQRLKTIIDGAGVGIASISREGKWEWMNDSLCEFLGFSREELMGLRWQDVTHPDDVAADEALAGRLRAGEISSYSIDKRYIRKDWQVVWGHLTVSRQTDPQGNPAFYIAVIRDITARKRAEEALREQEHFARRLIDSTLSGMYIYDTRQGQITYSNPQYERITGWSQAELNALAPEPFLDLFHPEDRPRVIEHIRAVREALGEEVWEIEYRFRRPEGTWIWCLSREAPFERDRDGTVRTYIGSFIDITDRKLAEDAVRRSEQRWRSVFAGAPIGMVITDLQGRFEHVNDAYCRLAGYTREELQAGDLSFLELTHPEDREETIRQAQRLIAGEIPTYSIEKRYVRRDGGVTWVRASAVLRQSEHHRAMQIIGLVEDITDRKRAEEALRESETRFRAAFADAPIGMVLVDPAGHYLYVNAAYCRIVGYSEAELLRPGFDFQRITHPDDVARQVAAIRRLLAGEIPSFFLEKRNVRKDGSIVWLRASASLRRNASGEPYQIIGLVEDVTDRVHAESALREQEARLRLATDAAHLGVFVWDVGSDTVTWENDRMYEIFGVSREDPPYNLAALMADIVHPDDRESFDANLRSGMTPGGTLHSIGRIRRKDGEYRWVEVAGRCEFDDDGACRRLVGILADITDRVRAEQQLREARDELEQRVRERTAELQRRADQLARLTSELTLTEQRERRRLAQILHDHLQQMLVGAKFGLEVLARRVGEKEQADLWQVHGLLDESINVSRSLTVELSPPILHEGGIVAGLEWLVRWVGEKHGLTVDLHTDDHATTDREDVRVLLFQAVRELLFNVVKHARVTRAAVTLDLQDADHLRLTVHDEGVGFDPQAMWNRAPAPTEGGFGLFSLRERLNLLGGRLTIDSAAGEGVTVTIVAPRRHLGAAIKTPTALRHRAAPETTPAAAPPEAPGEERPIRVLLADDHAVVRQGIRLLLRDQPDIEVVGEAADGDQAVDSAHRLRPDVILMDYSMPRMSGVDATRAIHRELPGIRIIGLSMYEQLDRAAAMIDAGATGYITKSGPSEELLAAVRGE